MKKILSLILALLMSASCAATIFADDTAIADTATEETTATEATPYDLALEFLDAKKIMQGWDGELHPEKAVRRFEMALFVTRISTGLVDNEVWEDGPINGTEFTDLEGSAAADYLGALSYANQHGIINGYEDGTFKPENTVTYRDALVMACRTLGYTGLEYKWGYIEKAVTLGLTEGITNVAYTDTITRGVAAQIIFNALEAKTAAGKKLAQESFDFDYDWKQIVVVRDAKRTYIPAEITAPAKDHVGFKFVEKDGTFSEETLYVNNVDAGLKFGEFYNAYIGKIGGEYVDLFKTEQIVPGTLITNDGNDDTDGVHDDVTAALANKTLVSKYEQYGKDYSYNYSLSLVGRDELILVTPGSATVVIGGYDFEQVGVYGINWLTGDIVKKTGENTYETVWYYNAEHDVYFRYKKAASNLEGGFAGIEVMDDADLAALKVAIQESYLAKANKPGYVVTSAPVAGYQYSSLLTYDLNEDGKYDYAKYEQYAFGKYATGKCAHGVVYHEFQGAKYYVADCDKCKFDASITNFSFVEGYTPDGFTGYCVYGVNPVTKELKIIKKVVDKASTTDADTYYAYGVVRGFDVNAKSVTIDDQVYNWGADTTKLSGINAGPFSDNETYYESIFNQYVKYTLVDGKLNFIDIQSSSDYIIVERYLGIDNDGYIVIQGYSMKGARTLTTFRIESFDGWKVGDAFFYGDNHDLEYYFTKGNVYAINSYVVPTNSYNVTPIGLTDPDTGKIVGVAMTGTVTKFTFEDSYILKNDNYAGKMSSGDTYIIIGEKDDEFNFKPITIYTGIVPNEWEIKGTLITSSSPYIFVNVAENDVIGFNYEVKTGFVATLNKRGVVSAYYDDYNTNTDYYYYGATAYQVAAYDLLNANTNVGTGLATATATAYNFKPEKNSIYITIDGQIVDDTALTYADFKKAMTKAYGDGDLTKYNETIDSATYIPFTKTFTAAAEVTDKNFSSWMSTKEENGGSYYFELKKPHEDLLAGAGNGSGIITYTVITDDYGYVTDIKLGHGTLDWAYDYTAFCFYVKATNKVHVFFCADDSAKKPTKVGTDATEQKVAPSTNIIEVADEAYIDVTAGLVATPVKGTDANGFEYVASYDYAIDSLTFNWEGDFIANSNHATIEELKYYFGNTGAHTTESWNATQGVAKNYNSSVTITRDTTVYDDQVLGTTYAACDEEGVDCDLIDTVKVVLDEAVPVTDNWTAIQVRFETHTLDANGAKADLLNYVFTVVAKLNADGNVEIKFNTNAADLNKNSAGILAVVEK